MLKDHNAVTPVWLKPAALRSRVKHSTTEPLRSPIYSRVFGFAIVTTKWYTYTRGVWERIIIFLHFSCKLYMRLKSYSQVLMCNPEMVWICRSFDCTITWRCWRHHMVPHSIQHLSAQLNEAFWLFLCLNCGMYDNISPKEFIDFF